MVKAGVIWAGSVGFRVLEVEIPDRETAKDGTSLIFRKQELLEFSICNVPANPFALMKNEQGERSGAENQTDFQLGEEGVLEGDCFFRRCALLSFLGLPGTLLLNIVKTVDREKRKVNRESAHCIPRFCYSKLE